MNLKPKLFVDGFDRRSSEELNKLLKWDLKADKYPLFPPILFEGNEKDMTKAFKSVPVRDVSIVPVD